MPEDNLGKAARNGAVLPVQKAVHGCGQKLFATTRRVPTSAIVVRVALAALSTVRAFDARRPQGLTGFVREDVVLGDRVLHCSGICPTSTRWRSAKGAARHLPLRVVNSTLPTSQGTQNVGPVEFTTLRYGATAPARREFSGRRW